MFSLLHKYFFGKNKIVLFIFPSILLLGVGTVAYLYYLPQQFPQGLPNAVNYEPPKPLKPVPKTVWLVGVTLMFESTMSWVEAFPLIVSKRYPSSEIFVIDTKSHNGTRFTQQKDIYIRSLKYVKKKKHILPRTKKFLLNATTITNITSPDIIFVRHVKDSYKHLVKLAPQLFTANTLRIVYPIEPINNVKHVDYVVHPEDILKSVPDWQIELYEENIKQRILSGDYLPVPDNILPTEDNYKLFSQKKDNFLLYAAQVISSRKSQKDFVKKLDPKTLEKHNCTIVFLGKLENSSDSSFFSLLQARNISYQHFGYIENRTELIDLYVRARGVVLTSYQDSAPRVIFEGLFGNTPFLVSPQVEFNPKLEKFGVRLKSPVLDDINQGIDLLLSTDWGNSQIDFARNHLNDSSAFEDMFKHIDSLFCSKNPNKCK